MRNSLRNTLRYPISIFLLASCLLTGQAHGQEQQPQQQQQQEREATIESVRQEVQDLNQELAEFTADRRQQLMEDIEGTLKAIDTRVDALETRLKDEWNEMDEVARAHARSTLGALRRERARVAEWYQRMQDLSLIHI